MRDKLNDNPIAQLALVGVLLVLGVVVLLKPGGGGESEESSSSGEVTATAESVEEPAVEEPAAGATGGVPTSIPVSPPPRQFSAAYDAGKTVVLLVVHDGGIDDAYTAAATSAIVGVPDTELIVVPAAKIARYAAVTVGLDLSQVPALVVMKPKHLSHGVPQATVKYGFQTPQSVIQAVRDAAYKGPETTYHPD